MRTREQVEGSGDQHSTKQEIEQLLIDSGYGHVVAAMEGVVEQVKNGEITSQEENEAALAKAEAQILAAQ